MNGLYYYIKDIVSSNSKQRTLKESVVMAAFSLNRFVSNLMRFTPHFGLYALRVGLWIGGLAAATFIGAESAKWFDEQGNAIRRGQTKRKSDLHIEHGALVKEENAEQIDLATKAAAVAQLDAEHAQEKKPIIVEQAIHRSDQKVSEKETASDLRVVHAKTTGKERKIDAVTETQLTQIEAKTETQIAENQQLSKHSLKEIRQKARLTQQEHETSHKTNTLQNTQEHLERLTVLTQKLTETSQTTTGIAKDNKAATVQTTEAINELKTQMQVVIGAHGELNQVLNQYDLAQAEGDLAHDRAELIQQAMLKAIIAEGSLEAKIASSSIASKSTLRQTFKADLAAQTQQIDTLLASHATETLAKVTELTKAQMIEDQQIIGDLTSSPENRQFSIERLGKLQALLDRVEPLLLAQDLGVEQDNEDDNLSATY